MNKRDYYEVLGLPREATEEQIKRSYRQLVLKHHPDRNPDDRSAAEERFKEISEAYEILSDAQKRATYDRYGHQGVNNAFGGHGFSWENFTHFSDLEDILGGGVEDLFSAFGFSDMFGRSGGRRQRAGRDLKFSLDISLEEAARDTEQTITVPRNEDCAVCKGSGARPGTQKTTCSVCRGRGKVTHSSGFFTITQACSTCAGEGYMIKEPCRECNGSGRNRVVKKIKVKIPAGIEDGMHLKIRQEGESGGPNVPCGDLYVQVRVRPHDLFQRDGSDLLCEVPISVVQAICGDEIEVPLIEGKETVTVPPGTQPGTVLKLKDRGLPRLDSRGRGTHYVRLRVVIPTKITAQQRTLLEEFARSDRSDTATGEGAFSGKIKDIFKTPKKKNK